LSRCEDTEKISTVLPVPHGVKLEEKRMNSRS